MKAKSSLRLRLESLETRSMLSAIGLPLPPPAVPPTVFAAAGEFYRTSPPYPSGQHAAPTALLDAVRDSATTPLAIPMSARESVFRRPRRCDFRPIFRHGPARRFDDLTTGCCRPVQRSSARPQLPSDRAPSHEMFLLPDPMFGAADELADSGSVVPIQDLSDSSPVVNFDPTRWHGDAAASIASIDAAPVPASPAAYPVLGSRRVVCGGRRMTRLTSRAHHWHCRF